MKGIKVTLQNTLFKTWVNNSIFIGLFFTLLINISDELYGQGKIESVTFYSNSLQMNRNVQIYLPEGYDNQEVLEYPVIYYLHGATGNHQSNPELKNILDTLIGNNHMSPAIVVKPDGSVVPWAGSMYTNSELYGNFEDYIVFDLVDFIDSEYKTSDKRAIWGRSMGGFGSIKLALKHPDIYCATASHSGLLDFSHWVDWVPTILNENGGPPVNNYITTPYTFSWLFYTFSGAFSPNLSNPPTYLDFPLDSEGNFIDSIFNRWQLHNPVRLAANLPPNSDLAIYFDCGMQDELLFYPFNTGFADSLDLLGIDYVFESFNGTHSSEALKRVPIALMFLDSAMNETGTSGTIENWVKKNDMPTARGWLSSSVINNTIYAVGGAIAIGSDLDALEAFDPETNTWTIKASMPTPRGFLSSCAVDGIIYAIGGGWDTVSYPIVEAYDPSNDTWTTKSPMPTARAAFSVCEVGGIIYAIGGFNEYSGTGLTAVEAYDPKTDIWTIKASMPTPRMGFTTSVVNGIVYVFGGLSKRGSPSLSNVEAYDPKTDTWTIKNNLPSPRAGMTTCTVDGIIYGFGGVTYGSGRCYSTMSKYNPASDSWTELPDMPYEVGFHSNCIIDGKIYLIGGVNTPRVPLDAVYEYTPAPTSNIAAGNVSGTWTLNGSPYYINGEITVPNDSTLTIKPGVEVIFTGHYKFNVQGRLLAIGTEADTIVFTINDTTGFHDLTIPDGGWGGIKLKDISSSNDSTIFEYCSFQYGKTGNGGAIYSETDKLRISHCLFRNNVCIDIHPFAGTGGAIYILDCKPIIEYSEFCSNKAEFNGSALYIVRSDAIIRNNHFHHNLISATIAIRSSSPIFINNLIEQNHSLDDGILLFRNDSLNATIINNTIVNNSCAQGAILTTYGLASFINNIIFGNEPSQVNLRTSSSISFYNCLIEGGKEGFAGAPFTGTYENCIDADPLFIDMGNGDYHLSDQSPCIGAGYYEEGLTPTCDCEGNLRPIGSNPDIGAYENELTTDINEEINQRPSNFALSQNYPNPFNPTTTIKYSIPSSTVSPNSLRDQSPQIPDPSAAGGQARNDNVTIKVYDILGREVTTLVNKKQKAGYYEIEWDTKAIPSGVYFYQLTAGQFVETKKMILLR